MATLKATVAALAVAAGDVPEASRKESKRSGIDTYEDEEDPNGSLKAELARLNGKDPNKELKEELTELQVPSNKDDIATSVIPPLFLGRGSVRWRDASSQTKESIQLGRSCLNRCHREQSP